MERYNSLVRSGSSFSNQTRSLALLQSQESSLADCLYLYEEKRTMGIEEGHERVLKKPNDFTFPMWSSTLHMESLKALQVTFSEDFREFMIGSETKSETLIQYICKSHDLLAKPLLNSKYKSMQAGSNNISSDHAPRVPTASSINKGEFLSNASTKPNTKPITGALGKRTREDDEDNSDAFPINKFARGEETDEKKDKSHFLTARQQLVISQKGKNGSGSNGGGDCGLHIPSKRPGLSRRGFNPPSKLSDDNDTRKGGGDALAKNVSNRIFKGGSGGGGSGGGGSNNELTMESLLGEDVPDELKHIDPKLVEMIMSEMMDQTPDTKWEDIAGLHFAKRCVQEAVVLPILNPDLFTGLRRLPRGILFFGPPGTGKTLIGKAVASESGASFFSISASSLTSKWAGEAEKLVKVLFTLARLREPAIVFIDEIDSLLCQRSESDFEASRRIKTEFLVQLDGVSGHLANAQVIVIGATNRPQEIDEAARRRFVKRLYIPLPDEEARAVLVQRLMKKNQHTLSEDDFCTIVKKCDGYSGADIHSLCSEASMGPIRDITTRGTSLTSIQGISQLSADKLRPISFADFETAFRLVKSSVAPSEIEQYLLWNKQFGSWDAEAKL